MSIYSEVTNYSGADMWNEYLLRYGEAEARVICNRYLDMQILHKDPEEIQFCKELYAAMQNNYSKQSADSFDKLHKSELEKAGDKLSILEQLHKLKNTDVKSNTDVKKKSEHEI